MGNANYKVWIKMNCPYCVKAQALLLEKQLKHEVFVVDEDPALLESVQKKYDWKTVPVVVEEVEDSENFIGGYTDLLEHLNT